MNTTVECFTRREAEEASASHVASGHDVTPIGWNPDTGMHTFTVREPAPAP